MPFEKEKITYQSPNSVKRDVEKIRAREALRTKRAMKKILAGRFTREYATNFYTYHGGILRKHVSKYRHRDTFLEGVARKNLKENLKKCASNHVAARVTKTVLIDILKEIEANRLKLYLDKSGKKRKIICLMGVGGSGKTLAAMHMKYKFGVNVITPFTDRPPKEYELEGLDYHFIDINPPTFDILAFSRRNGYIKYALKSQAHTDVSIFMTERQTAMTLIDQYSNEYDIYSVLIRRKKKLRKMVSMDEEQDLEYDKCAMMNLTFYNYIIDNNGTKRELFDNIERIYEEIKNDKNDEGKERAGNGDSV